MAIELVPINTRQNDPLDLMNQYIKEFKEPGEILVASAFVDDFAADTVEEWLSNQNVKQIRLLTGVFGRQNRKSVFRRFERRQRQTGQLEVRISRDDKFHWKFYGFVCDPRHTYFLGSSNFTREGFRKPGNVLLAVRMYDAVQQEKLWTLFEIEWAPGCSRLLDRSFLESYEEARSGKVGVVPKKLREWLGGRDLRKETGAPSGNFFVACTSKILTKKQQEAVLEATRWPQDQPFGAIRGKDAPSIKPGDWIAWCHLRWDKESEQFDPEWLALVLVEDRYVTMSDLDGGIPILWDRRSSADVELIKGDVVVINQIKSFDWSEEPCEQISEKQWNAYRGLYQSRVAAPSKSPGHRPSE